MVREGGGGTHAVRYDLLRETHSSSSSEEHVDINVLFFGAHMLCLMVGKKCSPPHQSRCTTIATYLAGRIDDDSCIGGGSKQHARRFAAAAVPLLIS